MADRGSVRLVVQGDDAGMCHAVNEGIARSAADGILTRMSVMAPCGWFAEAAGLGVAAGLHMTLTCEWDHLRWHPLTAGPSLRSDDGTMHRTVAAAQAALDPAEAVVELTAQLARFTGAGLSPTHVDPHMGEVCPPAYAELVRLSGRPFCYDGETFTTVKQLSPRPAGDKVSWLLHFLEKLGPGLHLLVSHPGEGGRELSSITGRDSAVWPWAEDFRVSDVAALTDPAVRAAVERVGIELVAS